jgi:hypothetical protein
MALDTIWAGHGSAEDQDDIRHALLGSHVAAIRGRRQEVAQEYARLAVAEIESGSGFVQAGENANAVLSAGRSIDAAMLSRSIFENNRLAPEAYIERRVVGSGVNTPMRLLHRRMGKEQAMLEADLSTVKPTELYSVEEATNALLHAARIVKAPVKDLAHDLRHMFENAVAALPGMDNRHHQVLAPSPFTHD